MTSVKYTLYAILVAASLTFANPITPPGSHVESSLSLLKRDQFKLDDIEDDRRQEFLRNAQMEAVEIASLVLKKMDDTKYKPLLEGWFGTHDKDMRAKHVRGVLKNVVGDVEDSDGLGSLSLGLVKVYQEDFWVPDDVLFCDINRDGKTGTAYFYAKETDDPEKPEPTMHFCDKFFDKRIGKDKYLEGCSKFGNRINTNDIGRQFRGANVFHELMHYWEVGKKQIKSNIDDFAYGAYSCRKLALKNSKNAILNADTYVHYAMHIYLTEKCGRDFEYPTGPADD